MKTTIDISNLDKGAVLAALYNASRPIGMGFMRYDPKPMTPAEGTALLKEGAYFDYLNGRVMKISLDSDTLDPWGYDRDNGVGAVAKVIDTLRQSGDTNAAQMQQAHYDGKRQAAAEARKTLSEPGSVTTEGGLSVIKLGLADVADKLGPKLNEAVNHEKQ